MDATAGRRLTYALALLATGAIAGDLVRHGMFDTAPQLGMVEDPCQALREPRPLLARMLRGEGERWRLRDAAGLCHFRKDNARMLAAGVRPRVVMIGDSITAFWRRDVPGLFGDEIVDRGIAGQTSAQLLLRFEQDVVALRPRIVHIMVGTNDIAGNTGLTAPEDFQANIRAMVAIARANDIAVVIGALPPARRFSWRKGVDPRPYTGELNRWLRAFAAKQGLVFADYHAVLADRSGNPRPEFDKDGLHPNLTAYEAMRPVAEAAFTAAGADAPKPLS